MMVAVQRAIAAAFLVDVIPAAAQVATERLARGQPSIGHIPGIVLHMVLLALFIWLVARYHMHVSLRAQLFLPALAIFQVMGAITFGVIYAAHRGREDRRASEERVLVPT